MVKKCCCIAKSTFVWRHNFARSKNQFGKRVWTRPSYYISTLSFCVYVYLWPVLVLHRKFLEGSTLSADASRTKGYLESDREVLQVVDLPIFTNVLLGMLCILCPSSTSQPLQAFADCFPTNLISNQEKFQTNLVSGLPSLEESGGSSSC